MQEEEFKWLLAQEYRTRVEAISIKLRECKTKFLEAISMRGILPVSSMLFFFSMFYL